MSWIIKGKAYTLGNNVDTDVIIPGRYLAIKELSELAKHVLEPIDPSFHQYARNGVIIVAGLNFGMGSSREQAVTALKAAGVKAVVAKSFARIFYRNAINNALPVFECNANHTIQKGDILELDVLRGLLNWKGHTMKCNTLSGPALDILKEGGLLNKLKKSLQLR